MEALTISRVKAALTTRTFGRTLTLLTCTDSTNEVAKCLAQDGALEGSIVLAEEQMAGRGRLDRQWLAPEGTSLLCSILFRPQLLPNHIQRLTMLCALAAVEAVLHVTDLDVALKWPNDLVVEKEEEWHKLAGVLTEVGSDGDKLTYAVVGIGINVNVPPVELPELAPDATSLLAEIGRPVDRAELLAALLYRIERRYEALRAGENPSRDWAERLVTIGRRVDVLTRTGTLTGVAESVNEDGALLLRTDDGRLHRLIAGDVTLHRYGALNGNQ